MIQNILNDFYIIDKMKKDYYLMPIAIIPFGSGKNTLENRQKQARAEAKMQKAFTNALRAMQEVYKITYSFRIQNIKTNNDTRYDIEKRSDYKVFFSWSTGLILGKFSLQEFFEYILIECDLQNKWNGINRLTNKYREKNNRLTLLTELNLAKLEIFKVNLNSLNDAGDSERILIIKDKIIQSSRIYNIIAELKNLLSLNQQLNSKYISLIAVGISFISLIIAIILS